MRLLRFLIILGLVASATAQEANLKLRDVAGAEHSLAEYRGKIVVLNFWATWCIPCKYEMPLLVQLHEKYESQVVVIGASLDSDETQKRIPKFVEHHHVSFPVWTGATTATLTGFGLEGVVPSTLFIDRDGKILGRVIGEVKRKDLFPRVEWMLSDRSGPAPKPLVRNVD